MTTLAEGRTNGIHHEHVASLEAGAASTFVTDRFLLVSLVQP